MKSIDLATIKFQDLIRVDYTDIIPRNNLILEARRKRLDDLAKEERKYQKYLQPEENPTTRTLRWVYYTYGAYELIRCLLN